MSDDEEIPCPRLTPEERKKKFKPGSIYRVKLHNFLTYADVECFPGPRLNVVCGPNGTGKSTILCAICLGLGGQPPLLGRADDARTFIMHEKQIAIIEIELAPFPGKPTHVIRRTIDRSKGTISKRSRGAAASTYEINDEVVRNVAVKELVSGTYKIAIDNLCTFLPQDRVGSFSGFDSKQLLRETEKSVSQTQHLYNDHERLIDLEAEMLNSDSALENAKAELERLEAEVKKLEEAKKLAEEREESVKMQELYSQKIMWAEFERTRLAAVQAKEESKAAKKMLKEAKRGMAPLEEEIRTLNLEYQGGKEKRVSLMRQIELCTKNRLRSVDKVKRYGDEVDEIQAQLNAIDASHRRAKNDVIERRKKLEDIEAILKDYPPEEEIQEKCQSAQNELRAAKQKIRDCRDEFSKIQYSTKEVGQEYQTNLNRFNRMKDDKAMRNEKILNREKSLREALEWINANRKLFRRPVHGPIVCEITTRDSDVSNYLEQHVRNTILKSFIVECREDMNLLYREVRGKRKIRINIQMVDQGKLVPSNPMYSDHKMQILKQEHDVRGYLDEFFDAPDAIMQALRNTSNVQAVLIGGQRTKDNLDNEGLQDYLFERENGNGKQRFCIFAKDTGTRRMYKYTSTISRYDPSKTSVSTDEVNTAKMLSPGVPPADKERAQKALEAAEAKRDELQPSLDAAKEAHNRAIQEAQGKNIIFMDAKKGKRDYLNHKDKIPIAEKKLRDAEREASKDDRKEKSRCIKRMKKQISDYISELGNASKANKDYLVAISQQTGLKMSEDGLLEKKNRAQEKFVEIQNQTRSLQMEVNRKESEFKNMRNEVVRKRDIAARDAPISDASGNETPLKAKLDELPDAIAELEDLREEAKERVKVILNDPQILRKYNEEKDRLDSEKERYEILKGSKGAKRSELAKLKEPYVASLENITREVNALFTKYMGELGCAGEIAIFKGEQRAGPNGERLDNFKDWGIQIKVKFRATADLQVLSAQVHSGGERSVSTIMYLMAMQDLMVSPFRCVDEINQGLDERNERLVFHRIVQNSTSKPEKESDPSSHCGQYFLITPKLLPNLTDMEQDEVTVMCIFNGPYNFNHFSDWNVDSLLKMRRKRNINDTVDEELSPEKNRRIEEKKED